MNVGIHADRALVGAPTCHPTVEASSFIEFVLMPAAESALHCGLLTPVNEWEQIKNKLTN